MNTTPASLLKRLQQPTDTDAWDRFVRMYTPLLIYWARQTGLQQADAADLVQEVLLQLYRKLPEFHYDRNKSFRHWLKVILRNRWVTWRRRRSFVTSDPNERVEELADQHANGKELEESEYRCYIVRRALQIAQVDFEYKTWKACWDVTIEGKPVAVVAQELQMTTGAVHVAKFRVLSRLRLELAELLL
jgi:RNA polymerase sigma-70 factor (ECF subfamily)